MNTRPRCVVVTGRPGSGKTTLSRQLSDLLHMPMLSRDQIKEGRVSTFGIRHDLLPADTNLKVTEFFFAATSSFLQADISLVVEAAFQHKVWVRAVAQWSRIADLYFIICQVDPAVAARRHLDRGLGDPTREFYHGDNRVKVFRETGEFLPAGDYEPPAVDLPTLRVDTTAGYTPDLQSIRNFISPGPARQA